MRFLHLLMLLLAPPAAAAPAAAAPALVEVVRQRGSWSAEYRFPRAAPAWIFAHSALTRVEEQPWRPGSWTVETPGARIERQGWYDVIVGEGGRPVPRRVRIRFTPFTGDLLADYDPALAFTDGSIALFSDQFDVLPMEGARAAAKLPFDLNEANIADPGTRVTFRNQDGPLLAQGRRQERVTLLNGRSYVLFGDARTHTADAITTIIDPMLPPWLGQELADFTPRLLALYADRLGARTGSRPMLMVSWAGPTKNLSSMGGSVLPSLITMTFEGEGVVRRDAEMQDRARWFIAHEAAHFWLGETVAHEFSRDAWISEGGADLLAVRAIAALEPGYDARGELQRQVADCASLTIKRGVESAGERNEQRAYYACGAVFGLIAEGATKRDFFAFVQGLIDANRAEGKVSRGEWLTELTRLSGDASLGRDIGRLLDDGTDDPKALIASLFTRAGVRHSLAPDGLPTLS